MRFFALSLILAAAALGCGATSSGETSASTGSGTGGSGSGSGSGSGGASGVGVGNTGVGVGNTGVGVGVGGSSGSGTPADNCSDAAKLIYVLSDDNDLYSFEPDKKLFTKIGPLDCNTSLSPNSMAVDRNAVAYVNYVSGNDSQGQIFKVSTKDASCDAKPIISNLPSGFTRLGMGFSTDMAGGTAETLYVAGAPTGNSSSSPGLAKIDLTTNTLHKIGSFSSPLTGENAELTGTGDARLYGFFTTTPVKLAEIDKATGATKPPKAFDGIPTPNAWAFSFWGGDFYFYTAPTDFGDTTSVSRYRPSDGSVDTQYMTNLGFRIVGAGVSTCAPLVPPTPK